MSEEAAAQVATQGHRYLDMVWPLPSTFSRLGAGDTLTIGGRRFDILVGEGHAPEQLMLYCAEEKLFFAADRVLARITPNISVSAFDPEGDSLGLYLRSLQAIRQSVPEDALVLPGHELPFRGLHPRCLELIAHHEERCSLIAEACAGTPKSVADLVPIVFPRPLDPCMDRPWVARGFGDGEVGLAHMYPTLCGAELLAIMDIRAHRFSSTDRPCYGQVGHQSTHATARPFSISSSSRRPRRAPSG